jgi:hypothetical protein
MAVRDDDFDESVQLRDSILTALNESRLFLSDSNVVVTITCYAKWEVIACCEEELDEKHIDQVLTLTGSPMKAQAASCIEYMRQRWAKSKTGDAMMQAFRQAITERSSGEFQPSYSTSLQRSSNDRNIQK